jgi:hypothetical protein
MDTENVSWNAFYSFAAKLNTKNCCFSTLCCQCTCATLLEQVVTGIMSESVIRYWRARGQFEKEEKVNVALIRTLKEEIDTLRTLQETNRALQAKVDALQQPVQTTTQMTTLDEPEPTNDSQEDELLQPKPQEQQQFNIVL